MSEEQVEVIARAFHERYVAQVDGWKPQDSTRVAWEDLPEQNRSLMMAVVRDLRRDGVIAVGSLSTAGGFDEEAEGTVKAVREPAGGEAYELVEPSG